MISPEKNTNANADEMASPEIAATKSTDDPLLPTLSTMITNCSKPTMIHPCSVPITPDPVTPSGVCFAIPGPPNNAACFLARLIPIRLASFLTIVVLGGLPAYVVTNFAGESLAAGRIDGATIILGTVGLVSGLASLFRDDFQQPLERN